MNTLGVFFYTVYWVILIGTCSIFIQWICIFTKFILYYKSYSNKNYNGNNDSNRVILLNCVTFIFVLLICIACVGIFLHAYFPVISLLKWNGQTIIGIMKWILRINTIENLRFGLYWISANLIKFQFYHDILIYPFIITLNLKKVSLYFWNWSSFWKKMTGWMEKTSHRGNVDMCERV